MSRRSALPRRHESHGTPSHEQRKDRIMRLRVISPLIACFLLLGSLTAPRVSASTAGPLAQSAVRAEIRAFIADANACTPHSTCAALAALYAPAPTLRVSVHTGAA